MLDGGAFTTGPGADQNLVGGGNMKPFDFVFVRLLIHLLRGVGIMLLMMFAGLMLPLWWGGKTFFDFITLWGELPQARKYLDIGTLVVIFLGCISFSFQIENILQGIWSLSFIKKFENNETAIEKTMSEVKK
jgi:hypothetical protein